MPVIAAAKGEEDPDVIGQPFMENARDIFQDKTEQVFRQKLGFDKEADVGDDVWTSLEPLLRKSRVDWTVFWRQLTYVLRDYPDLGSSDYEGMMTALEDGDDLERSDRSPFYEALTPDLRRQWVSWLKQWRKALEAAGADGKQAFESMRTMNPKFVLREWMLVDAYTDAGIGEESSLLELHDLIQQPYDEGSDDQVKKYYRRAPERALTAGGTAFMS